MVLGAQHKVWKRCLVWQVLEGAELLVTEQCDVIVGFGGGSNLDVAKGIGIIATQGGARPIPPLHHLSRIQIQDEEGYG